MAKREIKEHARVFRRDGMAVREIAKVLHVSQGSVSRWVWDIALEPDQSEFLFERRRQLLIQENRGAQVNRVKFRALREKYQAEGRKRARQPDAVAYDGLYAVLGGGCKAKNELDFRQFRC